MSNDPLVHGRGCGSLILLTGATGFVGRATCRAFAECGVPVRAAVRHPADVPGAAEVRPVGDLADPVNWTPHLDGVEAVVHLAARVHVMRERAADPLAAFRAVNVAGTLRLAEAAANAGVQRFVFLSTIKVNGERTTGTPFTPADLPGPSDAYGQSKLEAEAGLQRLAEQGAFELVILRSPLVYGPGVSGNIRRLLRLVEVGVPLPFGLVQNRRSLLGLENFVSAIVRSTSHEARGGAYLLCDGPPVSTPELIRAIAEGLGRPTRLLPVPPGLLRLGGNLTGRSADVQRLLDSLEIDGTAAERGLGWTPPHSFDAGIRQMTDWYHMERSRGNG